LIKLIDKVGIGLHRETCHQSELIFWQQDSIPRYGPAFPALG